MSHKVTPRVKGKLTITVHEGKDLIDKDVGKQDPFAKIKFGDTSFKTPTHHKAGKVPKWGQSFLFNIKDSDLKEVVHFEVWDEDRLSNDEIGRINVSLHDLDEIAAKTHGQWLQLMEFDDTRSIAGYIRVSVAVEGEGWPSLHKKGELTESTPAHTSHPVISKIDDIKHKVDEARHKAEEEKKEKEKAEKEKAEKEKAEKEKETKVEKKERGKRFQLDDLHGLETRIQAKHSGLFLDVSGGSTSSGAKIIQWNGHDGPNQIFVFHRNHDDGTYLISPKHAPGKVLDIPASSKDDLAKLHIWDKAGTDNQRFYVYSTFDGAFQLVAKHSGKGLDVPGGSKDAGAEVIQFSRSTNDNQKWILVSLRLSKSLDGVESRIQNKFSSLFVDCYGGGTDNGTKIIQWTGTGGNNQLFIFNINEDGSYHISPKSAPSKCIDLTGGNPANGAVLILNEKSGADSQKWFLKPVSDGAFVIYNKHGGKAIDVPGIGGKKKETGLGLLTWSRVGGDTAPSQHFNVVDF